MPVAADVILEAGVVLHHRELVNLYGCRIGREPPSGRSSKSSASVIVGARCKISSHTFICEGVTIEDEVFIGHGVMFINDRHPKAATGGRTRQADADWTVVPTRVGRGASIGSGADILCGVTVGADALIGAGAVVTRDVRPAPPWLACRPGSCTRAIRPSHGSGRARPGVRCGRPAAGLPSQPVRMVPRPRRNVP